MFELALTCLAIHVFTLVASVILLSPVFEKFLRKYAPFFTGQCFGAWSSVHTSSLEAGKWQTAAGAGRDGEGTSGCFYVLGLLDLK